MPPSRPQLWGPHRSGAPDLTTGGGRCPWPSIRSQPLCIPSWAICTSTCRASAAGATEPPAHRVGQCGVDVRPGCTVVGALCTGVSALCAGGLAGGLPALTQPECVSPPVPGLGGGAGGRGAGGGAGVTDGHGGLCGHRPRSGAVAPALPGVAAVGGRRGGDRVGVTRPGTLAVSCSRRCGHGTGARAADWPRRGPGIGGWPMPCQAGAPPLRPRPGPGGPDSRPGGPRAPPLWARPGPAGRNRGPECRGLGPLWPPRDALARGGNPLETGVRGAGAHAPAGSGPKSSGLSAAAARSLGSQTAEAKRA